MTLQNRNRRRGKTFERQMADFFGLVRVPYSGSSETYGEGDLRDDLDIARSFYLGECKTITPRSKKEINFVIKRDWLLGDKGVFTRAKKAGNKFPFLVFRRKGSSVPMVILRAEDFRLLMQALALLRQYRIVSDTVDLEVLRQEIGGLIDDQKDANADQPIDD